MATRMQQRRGTAAQWTAANPVLAAGEIGFETDTSKFKMGNGSSAWSALTYFANAAELAAIIDSAPATLDTLNELAAAIGDDPAFFTTTTNNLALKAPLASPELTGVPTAPTAGAATNTTQIATTEFVQGKISSLVNGSPELLNTLSELSAALGNDPDFATTTANAIGLRATTAALNDHNNSTTSIHGIADTSVLVTATNLSDSVSNSITTHNSLTTNVHGIPDTSVLVTDSDLAGAVSVVSGDLGTHGALTTSVHGIADTSLLVTVSALEDALDGATVDQSSLAGTGINWNSVDEQFEIDSSIATTAYADQAEADAISAAAADATTKADAAVVSAGTAADTKISTAVAALTKSSVGLGNVDNTADSAKPVSTAQASAIATAKSEAIADATAQVNAVIASAPAALNTLDELAAALGDDANFASTVTTNQIGRAHV
jgi:hypothetical protein